MITIGSSSNRGFALVTALIFISALALIAVAIFSIARFDSSVARQSYHNARGDLASRNVALFGGFEESVFGHSQDTDDFITFRSEDPNGSDYFYTARRDEDGNWEYRPLFSGGKVITGSADLQKILLEGSQRLEEGVESIALPGGSIKAGDALRLPDQFGKPRIGWQVLRPDPDSIPADSDLNDFELRYAYWIEDLSGRLDGDLAGNRLGDMDGNDRIVESPEDGWFHYRGLGARIVEGENGALVVQPDPGELALFALITDDGTFPQIDADDQDSTARAEDADDLIRKLRSTEDTGLVDDYVISLLKQQETAPIEGFEATSTREWNSAVEATQKHVSFGTPDWQLRELIPDRSWIAAARRGTPKLALNPLIAKAEGEESDSPEEKDRKRDEVIREIAQHIKDCLPRFGSERAGGSVAGASGFGALPFSEAEYLHNLAANIVDYADRDLTPSVGSWKMGDAMPAAMEQNARTDGNAADGDPIVPEDMLLWNAGRNTAVDTTLKDYSGGARGYDMGDKFPPLYRGIDGQPFVMGLTNRLWYNDWEDGSPPSVKVQVDTWISIWNPFDTEISGVIAARLTEGWTQVKWGKERPILPHLNLPPVEVIVGPNEFTHVRWENVLTLESEGSGSKAPNSIVIDDRNFLLFEAGYQLYWADSAREDLGRLYLADRTRFPDSLNRDYRRTVRKGDWWYFSSGIGDSEFLRYPDPRSSLFKPGHKIRSGRRYFRSAYYNNLYLWGGGAVRSSYGDEIDPGQWGDHYHGIGSSQYNQSPNRNSVPEAVPFRKGPSPDEAPFSIKHPIDDYPEGYDGPGYYESLGELGNVYDPGCWTRQKSGNIAPAFYGGGRTLAIGSPEVRVFDSPGLRATDLLDIFCLDDEPRSQKGLVNVNSASEEVLRTLVAGMRLDDDPAMEKQGGGDLYPPSEDLPGDLVAEEIARARPFSVPNNLLFLEQESGAPFFGDPSAWPNGQRPTALDDAGREELARRFVNLVTTRSRVFRIYLTAHVVDLYRTPGSEEVGIEQIVSRKSRIYDVFLRPVTDDTGAIVDQKIEIYYEKDL